MFYIKNHHCSILGQLQALCSIALRDDQPNNSFLKIVMILNVIFVEKFPFPCNGIFSKRTMQHATEIKSWKSFRNLRF